ncbi:MAG: RecX family transcriptional regulator [Candidatus Marinimicrobia bacterium]|nr:RecX family transcriptional regulator [Candidatus Neomarinimicrobiota bacterium]
MFETNLMPENSTGRVITKIGFQVKRITRRSIFLDSEYSFSISPETYDLFPIKKGQTLTDKQIQVIQNHEQFEKVKNLALNYIGLRIRSTKEVQTYLKRKKIHENVINRVIQYCNERNYLDDYAFAKAFTKDQLNLNKSGVFKIRSSLRTKGIAVEIIDLVVEELINRDEQLDLAAKLGKRKLRLLTKDTNKKQKIYRFLLQKGFSRDVVAEVLKLLF